MNELHKKYAEVLLKNCLKIKENQPLFISANIERKDFVRIVANIAYEMGVKDIYFDLSDPYLKHDALLNLTTEELKKTELYNKAIWNEYADRGAAFLMLASETPGLMKDIDAKKNSEITMHAFKTRKHFDDLRDQSLVPWCIACVPTESWAKELFPDSKDATAELWDKIFTVCHIKEENPSLVWEEKINLLSKRCEKLNEYNFTKLKYKNSKGTDFEISLPKNHIWRSGLETLQNGTGVLVNFPTEEVFCSPLRDSANGIVYSSKPLAYQGVIIDNFSITFKNGQAVSSNAENGAEMLNEMIHSCENSDYLGELALVEYTSAINKLNIVFQETLFDENASCHLALGDSFPECIADGPSKTKEELTSLGLNKSDNHVDFMIGTEDLSIIGFTQQGEEIPIFTGGNFTKTFK